MKTLRGRAGGGRRAGAGAGGERLGDVRGPLTLPDDHDPVLVVLFVHLLLHHPRSALRAHEGQRAGSSHVGWCTAVRLCWDGGAAVPMQRRSAPQRHGAEEPGGVGGTQLGRSAATWCRPKPRQWASEAIARRVLAGSACVRALHLVVALVALGRGDDQIHAIQAHLLVHVTVLRSACGARQPQGVRERAERTFCVCAGVAAQHVPRRGEARRGWLCTLMSGYCIVRFSASMPASTFSSFSPMAAAAGNQKRAKLSATAPHRGVACTRMRLKQKFGAEARPSVVQKPSAGTGAWRRRRPCLHVHVAIGHCTLTHAAHSRLAN